MPLTAWYDWLLIYLYDVGNLLLLGTAALLGYRKKSALALAAAIGFAFFIAGTEVQKRSQSAIVEAKQTETDYQSSLRLWYAGFIASSGGFLVGASSLFAFALRSTSRRNDKRAPPQHQL